MRTDPDTGVLRFREPVTLTCRECKLTLPLEAMKRHSHRPYGRDTLCLACNRRLTRERRQKRIAAGECREFGCPEKATVGNYCPEHRKKADTTLREWRRHNPGRAAAYVSAWAERMKARSDEQIEADLAEVLAVSPDGLLPCRAGHRAPAEEFYLARDRKRGRTEYCRAHTIERQRARATGRNLPSWVERDLYACAYCGAPFADIEHIVAMTADEGPGDVPRNTAPSCAECNRGLDGKWARPVEDWLHDLALAGDPRGVRREVWQDWPRVYIDVDPDGNVVDVDTGEIIEAAP